MLLKVFGASGRNPDMRIASVQLRMFVVCLCAFVAASVATPVQTAGASVQDAESITDLLDQADYNGTSHAQILRLYQAIFGRTPDLDGAKYWIRVNNGEEDGTRHGVLAIAAFMSASDEWSNNYAGTGSEEFLERVYSNVLGRDYDQAGFDYWLDILNGTNLSGENPDRSTLDRPAMVFYVTANPEFISSYPYAGTHSPNPNSVADTFAGTGPLLGYTTSNAEALPEVGRLDGRYRAVLTDNTDNKTLHFNESQGRLDAKLVSFPFDYVARNIGIGTLADSQIAPNPAGSTYMFTGVQVHTTDLEAADSAHVVVGHRGNTKFTIEGKNTVDGNSQVNDIGANTAPAGRADIRIVGNRDRTLTVYWQTPRPNPSSADDWQLYRGTGNLPGASAPFGESVYIGLITYAFGAGSVPFAGTADSIEFTGS